MPVARPESSDSRVIAHIDMDCFYVQVEQRRRPELKGLPTAVVQYNSWKGGGLIAVGYEARKDGVKRSMRGDEAKQVCPQIHLVQVPVAHGKADLSIYRNAGSEVVSILSKLGRCERASIDEVYLDLTEAAERMLIENPPESMEAVDQEEFKSHILGLNKDDRFVKEDVTEWICRTDADHRDKLLACGAVIVAELRMQVLKETEFTCSAGIAHNKMLAKLASGMNKPAQQTVVPFSSVKALLSSLPIKKMKQLGGKLGSSLQSDLGLNTVGDILQFSEEKLQERYGINTGTWLWNIARGISGEEVEGRLLPKSHGSGKTFSGSQALKTFDSVQHWLNELCEELSERLQSDMEQNKRIAQTLTLHASAYKSINIDPHKNFPSKSCPLRYGTAKIQQDALNLFQAGLREFLEPYRAKSKGSQHDGWKITGLSVSASKIVDIPSGTCSIMKYFHAQDLSAYPSKQPLEKATEVSATLSPSGTECQSEPNPTEPHLHFSVEESTINHPLSRLNHQQQEREIQAQITTGEQTSSFSLSGLSSPNDSCSEMNRVETQKDTHDEEIRVNDPTGSFEQPEQKRNKPREAGASSILKLFQNHSSHRSPGKQESTQSIDGTNATSSSGAESQSEVYPTEPHRVTIVEGSRTNHSLSRFNHQQQKKENQGTSILRLFQNHMSHCSTGKQELVQSAEDAGSGSGINSTQNGSGQDEQRRDNWNYKVDEIDPCVVDELPLEIQEEVRMWLHRPHKRPNVAKRGSSIAHYFLPTKNS